MGESQCSVCGHVVTGFEQAEYDLHQQLHETQLAELSRLRADLAEAVAVLANLLSDEPDAARAGDRSLICLGVYNCDLEYAHQVVAKHKATAHD